MIIEIATWIMYFLATYFAVFLLMVFLDKGVDSKSRSSKWRPMVSVAIPAYNEEDSIKGTVDSVMKLDYPREKLEIIIVDDCSRDKTWDVLNEIVRNAWKNGFNIRVLRHEVNRGKGAALNSALRIAKGEIFICLDADSFVKKDALLKMLPHFESGEDVASVLPFMKITRTNSFVLKIQWVEYLMNFFLKKISGKIDCIHVTPGPFGCYRKRILVGVGGFDENNLTEDLEMAVRLQKHNYKIIQLLDAGVVTMAPDTFKGFYKQRNRWYKGTLFNIYKYRDMLFNKKYGEFGVFHLPMVLGAAVLSISFALLIVFYRLVRPLILKLQDLSYIDFNFPFMIEVWRERFSFLDFNYMMMYFTVVVFVFSIGWIVLSHKFSKEKYFEKGFVPSVLFLAVYPIILSLIWAGVLIDVFLRRRQKW